MRFLVCLVACAVAALGTSCVRGKAGAAASPKPVVTPDTTRIGKVIRVNPISRYVIANFPMGQLPAPGQMLNVYRNGLKVGELKTDERWRRDDNVAADIFAGEVQVGDEVRDR